MVARLCSKFFKLGFSSMWNTGFRKGWVWKRQRNQRSNCQHLLDHRKSTRVPEKYLLYWLYQSLWLCGSQQTVENSSSNGNTRPPYLPPEKSVCTLMSIESVMPSNRFIFCHSLLLLPSIFSSIRVFSNDLALCIRWPKYWSFSFSRHKLPYIK